MKLRQLDAVRGAAAFYVFFHHARPLSLPLVSNIQFFGQEAVAIFFLMSGFVIQYSVASWDVINFRRYFMHRFRRIYPMLLISLFLAWIANRLAGGHVSGHWSLLASLLMYHDISSLKPGVMFDPWMGNDPLWSLSYEWWFYCLYPLVVTLVSPKFRKYIVASVGVLCGIAYHCHPNQISLYLSYFPLWWAGVELASEYFETRNVTFSGQCVSLLSIFMLFMLHICVTVYYYISGKGFSLGVYPFLLARHAGFVLFSIMIAIFWKKSGWRWFDTLLGPWAYLSSISFGIYVFHRPVLIALRSFGLNAWDTFLVAIPIVFILAYIAECVVQPKINRLLK